MILNLLSKTASFIKTTLLARPFTRTTPRRGLEEFFENGQSLPIYDQEKKVVYGKTC